MGKIRPIFFTDAPTAGRRPLSIDYFMLLYAASRRAMVGSGAGRRGRHGRDSGGLLGYSRNRGKAPAQVRRLSLFGGGGGNYGVSDFPGKIAVIAVLACLFRFTPHSDLLPSRGEGTIRKELSRTAIKHLQDRKRGWGYLGYSPGRGKDPVRLRRLSQIGRAHV